ncbi:MAG: nucleoside triphosphate pyrophosphohydrolase [bacterium]
MESRLTTGGSRLDWRVTDPGARGRFADLLEVVRRLRAECPWDRDQTVASTRPLVLNEAYELDEALASGDPAEVVEELGDYLFVGLFLADVLEAESGVRLEDALAGAVAKLKRRHPHVYGTAEVSGADEVLENWERIKQAEDKPGQARDSTLDGLPRALPALKQARLIQERCRRVGFDWTDPGDVLDKVGEEVCELRWELDRGETGRERAAEELGDVLFALVNLARHLDIDAESALRDANARFARRFRDVEADFRRRGVRLEDASLAEMDRVWDEVKRRQDD